MRQRFFTLALALTVTLAACLFAGCSSEPSIDPPPHEEPAVTYWVVETMTLEGTEFTTEDIEGIFGPRESVIALAVNASNTLDWVLFEDFVQCAYEGDATSFTFDLSGEKGTGQITGDGHLQLTFADGSIYMLVQQDEKPTSLASNPWTTYRVNFTADDTIRMSN